MISADGGGERDDAAMAVSLAAGSDSDRPMDRRSRPYWHGNKQRPVRSPREFPSRQGERQPLACRHLSNVAIYFILLLRKTLRFYL